MRSIRDIYKIGTGPSSSHTMGPARAAVLFRDEHPEADKFQAILYGSLSKTGRGHGTDRALRDAFAPIEAEVIFSEEDPRCLKHPNPGPHRPAGGQGAGPHPHREHRRWRHRYRGPGGR